jgi:hypothetical protein
MLTIKNVDALPAGKLASAAADAFVLAEG